MPLLAEDLTPVCKAPSSPSADHDATAREKKVTQNLPIQICNQQAQDNWGVRIINNLYLCY